MKLVRMIFIGVLIVLAVNINAFASTVNVELDGIGNGQEYASVISKQGNAMIPVRAVCEAAGFDVLWLGADSAAVIKADVSEDRDTALKKYVYSQLEKASEGKNLIPDCVILTLKLDREDVTLHYNYKDCNGETVSYGKSYTISEEAVRYECGSLYAPLRAIFNGFGLWVMYENNGIKVSIPEFVNYPHDLELVSAYEPKEEENSNMVYLGNFKITHYCACEKCCGIYAGQTAWGGALKPGYTIAVDPSVIAKLSDVYIDGYGMRVAEDCGGAIKGNRIDIAVSSHSEALALGVAYKDVWLVN